MNYSGILVVAEKNQLQDLAERLDALPSVEVHVREDSSGRLIIVQEAETVNEEVEGLKRIKNMPGVIMAEMVNHYFGENGQQEVMPDDLEELTGLHLDEVPAFLNAGE